MEFDSPAMRQTGCGGDAICKHAAYCITRSFSIFTYTFYIHVSVGGDSGGEQISTLTRKNEKKICRQALRNDVNVSLLSFTL